MDTFVQLTISGLANGAILALAALGFVLIYKASGVINFAQGHFLLVGAYVVWALTVDAGLHWAVAVAGAVLVAIALGLTGERFILRPLVGEPTISVIMVTIGLAQVLGALVQIIWGTFPQVFPAFIPDDTVTIGGAVVGENRLWALALAAVALAAFGVFFQRSRHGIAMRAVADDQQAALTMGISVRRTFALATASASPWRSSKLTVQSIAEASLIRLTDEDRAERADQSGARIRRPSRKGIVEQLPSFSNVAPTRPKANK